MGEWWCQHHGDDCSEEQHFPKSKTATLQSSLRALVAEYRLNEPELEKAERAVGWRTFEFHWCRVWMAFAFWREPTLDPYAIGYGHALLGVADQLEALLDGEK